MDEKDSHSKEVGRSELQKAARQAMKFPPPKPMDKIISRILEKHEKQRIAQDFQALLEEQNLGQKSKWRDFNCLKKIVSP